MKTPLRVLQAALATAFSAGAALADPTVSLTVNSQLIGPGLLGTEGTDTLYQGLFNLSSVLSPLGHYQLQSATVSFQFADDNSDPIVSSNTVHTSSNLTGYSLTGSSSSGIGDTYYYTRQNSDYYTTTVHRSGESANVQLGFTDIPAFEPHSGTTTSTITSVEFTGRTSDGSSGYDAYYTPYSYRCGLSTCSGYYFHRGSHSYYSTDNYSFTDTITIDPSNSFGTSTTIFAGNPDLLTLAQTGELAFQLGIHNDLILTSATLTVTALPVPEPETYAMMLAGLGLLCLARRRKVPC